MSYSAWLSCKCCGQRIGDEEGIPYGHGQFFSVMRLNGMTGRESLPLLAALLQNPPGGIRPHLVKLEELATKAPQGEWVVL